MTLFTIIHQMAPFQKMTLIGFNTLLTSKERKMKMRDFIDKALCVAAIALLAYALIGGFIGAVIYY